MTRLRVPLRLAAPAALLAAAAAAYGFSWFVGAGGVPLVWKTHFTTMYASQNTLPPSSVFGSQFRSAASAWGSNPNSDFRFFVNNGFHDAQIGDLDGFNDVYFSTAMGYYTLGVTYVYSNAADTELWDCDVAFNGYYYTFAPGYYDFQSVAVHELGHALGLGHTGIPGSVMEPFIGAGTQNRTPKNDDLAGETFLYPKPGGGGGPPPVPGPGPGGLPVRTGTMTGLSVSDDEVLVGDALTFTAVVTNSNAGSLLLSGAETAPLSAGAWEEVLMGAGETRGFSLQRTVVDLPGLYPIRLRLGGLDPTMVYVAQQTIPGTTVRVRRPPVALTAQDDLTASLGPQGDDRVELFLAKGQRIGIELLSSSSWPGGRSMRFLDPSGAAVRKWAPGKTVKAKAEGVHALLVANGGADKGSYRLFTECPGAAPRIRARGALDGTGPAEVTFAAAGRSAAVVRVKGPRKLAPRIVSLRSPSGATVDVPDGAEVAVDEFGEDGVWTAVVEGAAGVSGKFRIQARPTWLEGMDVTR